MPELPTSPFVSARRAPRRRWVRGVQLLTVTVMVLAVAAKGGAAGLARYADRRLQRVPLAALARPHQAGTGPNAGAARRAAPPAEHPANARPRGAQPVRLAIAVTTAGERPLSAALVSTPGRPGEAVVIALPIELQVEVPGRGTTTLAGALRGGGPDLLVEAVTGHTGIPVHHYVQIDLAALAPLAGGTCPPLRPTVAATVEAQLRFLGQAAQALLAPRTLLNPPRLRQALDRVAAAVRTDDTVASRQLMTVVRALAATDRIRVVTVPPVVRLPQPPAPAEVDVQVMNGAGVTGLAARAGRLLAARGFRVTATGNLEGFGLRRTEVRYGRGLKSEAELVARHLRGATLAETALASAVVVALGEDWAEEPTLVQQPTMPAAPTPQAARGPCA